MCGCRPCQKPGSGRTLMICSAVSAASRLSGHEVDERLEGDSAPLRWGSTRVMMRANSASPLRQECEETLTSTAHNSWLCRFPLLPVGMRSSLLENLNLSCTSFHVWNRFPYGRLKFTAIRGFWNVATASTQKLLMSEFLSLSDPCCPGLLLFSC